MISNVTGYSSIMQQQLQAKQTRKEPNISEMSQDMLSKADSDENGALSIEELGLSEESFALVDTDGDGSVTQEELQTLMETGWENKGGDEDNVVQELFQTLLDGKGGESEASSGSEISDQILTQLDTDGDGVLSQEELGMDDEMFASLDTDEDGTVSSEEFAETMQAQGSMPPPPPPSEEEDDSDSLLEALFAEQTSSISDIKTKISEMSLANQSESESDESSSYDLILQTLQENNVSSSAINDFLDLLQNNGLSLQA